MTPSRRWRRQGSNGALDRAQGYTRVSLSKKTFTTAPSIFDAEVASLPPPLTTTTSGSHPDMTTDLAKATWWEIAEPTRNPMYKSPGPYPQQQLERNREGHSLCPTGLLHTLSLMVIPSFCPLKSLESSASLRVVVTNTKSSLYPMRGWGILGTDFNNYWATVAILVRR